jgi:hypothetical protein
MGARQKLNRAYINGTLLTSGALGAMTGSWTVFVLSAAGLIVANLWNNEIRLKQKPRRSRRR